jgi:transposase
MHCYLQPGCWRQRHERPHWYHGHCCDQNEREPLMKVREVISVLNRIACSPLSVAEFFRRNKVPFSRSQYYVYRDKFKEKGAEGLKDGRAGGNRRTLTAEVAAVIRAFHHDDPTLSLSQLAAKLKSSTGTAVAASTISRFLSKEGLKIQPRAREPETEVHQSACGGFEIVAALALHLGWARHTADVLAAARERFKRTNLFRNERRALDRRGRGVRGRFTRRYNTRKDRNALRFASIQVKRRHRNYSRMSLFNSRHDVLVRKCLCTLSLPLFTINGMQRSINNPLREQMGLFCGYKYKHATIDKWLRELKYLGTSSHLLRDQVGFWQNQWRMIGAKDESPLLCYYIDGNTKPLWSKKRVKQNKVTMLGRVMGCIEQVFVHDGRGRPVYMESYSGKAPVGEHVLEMFQVIEESLEGPGPSLKVTRALVMDSASNGVSTLRAFANQDKYHYITSLDDNQWDPRKVLEEGPPTRYHYGKATLRDCRIELEDSKEKGFRIDVRAIRIDWDHGKRTVLPTSIAKEVVGSSLVVKAYFDRWPCEELQFRQMKSFACLNRVAGYGKQELDDENMRAKQEKLEAKVTDLRQGLAVPRREIKALEEKIAAAIDRERRLKAKGRLVNGKRLLKQPEQLKVQEISRQIAAWQRQIKAIESEWDGSFEKLEDCEKEWLRIRDKGTVYRNDVELDQLMGFFRIALVNIICWFITECLEGQPMALARVFMNILLLPAQIRLTAEFRRVVFKRDDSNPDLMALLERGLRHLTKLKIKDLEERTIEFELTPA